MSASKLNRPVAEIVTRDIPGAQGPTLSCSECGFNNKVAGRNQKCQGCGFTLKVELYPDRTRYLRGAGTTASGGSTLDINDGTAQDLRGMDENKALNATAKELAGMDRQFAFSKKMGREFGKDRGWDYVTIQNWLFERYEGRNPGMVRMNCGNVLRSARKRQDEAENGIA